MFENIFYIYKSDNHDLQQVRRMTMNRKRAFGKGYQKVAMVLAVFMATFSLSGTVADAADITMPPQTGEGHWDYDFTGGTQTFTVPTDGYYGFELYGAQGGDYADTFTGGKGGYVKAVLNLKAGDVLYINVGGKGNLFNGGGKGTLTNGGGATDIRLNGRTIADRVVVAGGGGGASHVDDGKAGGATTSLRTTASGGKPEDSTVPHHHIGSEEGGGECYQDPVYHVHEGSADDGTGCYTLPNTHKHEYNGSLILVNNTDNSQYKDEGTNKVFNGYVATAKGKCYNKVITEYHFHTDDCYTDGKLTCGKTETHYHTGNSTDGGGCYTTPVYNKHVHKTATAETDGSVIYATENPGGCYVAAGHTHNKTGECAYTMSPNTRHVHTSSCPSVYHKADYDWVKDDNDDGEDKHGWHKKWHPAYTEYKCGDSPLNAGGSVVWQCGSPVNTWKIGCNKTVGERYESDGVEHWELGCGKEEFHVHEGSAKDGGECYQTPVYKEHHHVGSASEGTGCYTIPIYHSHTNSCYSISYSRCPGHLSVDLPNNQHWGCDVCGHEGGGDEDDPCPVVKENKTLICSKNSSTIDGYRTGCGKAEGTIYEDEGIDHYKLSCTKKAGEFPKYYALDCQYEDDEVLGYTLGCNKTETYVEKYNLTCTKIDDGGPYEGEAGLYGGGGGYYGGTIGEPIYHVHAGNPSCAGGCYVAYTAYGTAQRAEPFAAWVTDRVWFDAGCSCGGCWNSEGHYEFGTKWVTYTYSYTAYRPGCGKTEGVTIDSYKGGFGGSNYVTPDGDLIKSEAGVQEGNGFCKIVNVYGINYNLNKGSFETEQPKYIWYGEEGIIDHPVRTGYTFQGWDIEGMDDCVHTIGNKTTTSHTATRIKDTLFKNLRCFPGYVKFTAIWRDETKPDVQDISYVNENATEYNEKKYTPGKWTGQSVIATVTAKDEGSGVKSVQWNGKKYPDFAKASYVSDISAWIMNPNVDPTNFVNSKTFAETGVYNGTVFVRDNADTSNEDHISNTINVTTVPYGDIKIDKVKPTVVVEYQMRRSGKNSDWKKNGETPTNEDVIVRVSAKDTMSGLHVKAYSWDGEDWIDADAGSKQGVNEEGFDVQSYTTRTFEENTSGTVRIRDEVGNIIEVTYTITGIDKKAPFVFPDKKPKDDDVPGEPLPKDPDNEEDYDYKNDTNYTFQTIGSMTYDWVNSNLNTFVFGAADEENLSPSYSASGIARMEVFDADKNWNFTESDSVAKVVNPVVNKVSYTCERQGISYLVFEVEDYAENITQVRLTVKIDKTAPIVPERGLVANFEIEDINLNKYGIDEVENKIKDTAAMKRTFKFLGTDYNNEKYGEYTTVSDSSGIAEFKLKLINADDATDYKEYDLGYMVGTTTNTDEFAAISAVKAIVNGYFGDEINTFTDFPTASALKYELTLKDRAGNETTYKNENGNEIKNFSIKAVIHYAGVADEDISVNSNAASEFNVVSTDDNGKKTNIPYFVLGDFGYVEVWTVGYVPYIQFDFKDMGSEAATEIKDGKLPRKYNLGITTDTAYMRKIPVTQAVRIETGVPDYNGVPYGAHYGVAEGNLISAKRSIAFMDRFKEFGTAIRLPSYYTMTSDGTKKQDGLNNYYWEVHSAVISAVKGTGAYTYESKPLYVIWDENGSGDVHYRITHES